MHVIPLLGVLLLAVTFSEAKVSYRGYHVVSMKTESQDQVDTLLKLQEDYPEIVFLSDPSLIRNADAAVPPQLQNRVYNLLRQSAIGYSLLTGDLQADMDSVMAENEMNAINNNKSSRAWTKNGRYSPPHNVYYQFTQVNDIMTNLANAYPDIAVLKDLPLKSEEGRTVRYLELGTAGSNKPVIFIEGLAHAREWVVTASLIYTIDNMLSGYVAGDASAVNALTKYTWVIIPVVNPDGYVYSWTSNRLWRKNRKFISNRCSGVDLNRNYDVMFGGVGTSTSCTSDIYHGGSPFSEAETQNVALLFQELQSRVVSFLSVHAYSQLLLYPWGYVASYTDPNPPANLAQLISMGQLMKASLDSLGRTYLLGTAYGVLGYAAAGAAEDWALQTKPGIFAYCYELRPATASQGGFDIPPSEIVPTGTELLRSLYTLAENMDSV